MIASTTLRVRYKDTDCMKVVYYGNYLTYFEVGRVEFLRQQGLAISDVDQRIHLPVVEALVRFRKPARLDDLLEVRCWLSECKRASFRFGYEIRNEAGEPVATDSPASFRISYANRKLARLRSLTQQRTSRRSSSRAGLRKRTRASTTGRCTR